MNAKRILLALVLGYLPISSWALTLSQSPLFIASTEPRIMLVASKDHQLSIKAYTDYSDLDNDNVIDTTYNDAISYYGYFDSNKCYAYTPSGTATTSSLSASGGGQFYPFWAVTSGTHQCDGSHWSGNFLNWSSMTRMDILRKTFYGGYRSTDSTSATVLERHFLPNDVHAFVKVYKPTGSMPTIQSLTGISGQTEVSLCNVSDTTSTTLTGQMTTLPLPLIKVASGSWPQWDSSEVTQCELSGATGNITQPSALIGSAYTARVKVCDSTGGTETNCKTYTTLSSGATTSKPIGLLQTYGDVDADRRVRFGLMTGSYAANKSGGELRKNIGFIDDNNGATLDSSSSCSTATSASTVNGSANDEINVCTGQFINQASTQAGIINTLNRLHIAGYEYTSGGLNNKHRYSCDSPGILTFSDGQCVDWGNPLSEIYLETLRYFANAGHTTAFDQSDASILSSIPTVPWTDPLPSTQWCALSSIVVLSTGLNSFDTDQLTSFTPSGGSAISAATLTQTVGDSTHENINGGSYLIGDNGVTSNNQCTAKTISNLATAKGICPEVPSTQGGYGIAGLAYAPKTIDLRPGYATQREARWGGATPINKDWALRQPINTYAVQLAESLPSFSPTVGSGTVTLLPACLASATSSSPWTSGSTGWRNCSMTNLIVNPNVAMASVGSDSTAKTNTCSGNGTTSQCFTVAWEDSTWGNDYDMDGIQRLGYCAGSACDTFRMVCPTTSSGTATIGSGSGWAAGATASDQIRIATCAIQANSGHPLTFGYTVTGTTTDGVSFPIFRPGGSGTSPCSPGLNYFSIGCKLPTAVTAPNAVTFSQGPSTAKLLKNPLWYAAKYGGFTESTPASGTPNPDLTSEWDKVNNTTGATGADGIPDNYYDVRNPANLITAMASIFDSASTPDTSAASVATNSTSLQINSRVFQAKFSSADWSGQLLSYKISTAGVLTVTPEWDAGELLNAAHIIPSSRVILTKGTSDGLAFTVANITSLTLSQQSDLASNAAGLSAANELRYLRGNASNEGTTSSTFRQRNTSKLGDIVNSSPWYVGAPAAGYSDVDSPGYSSFRSGLLSRKPVVYVAANDGMLHGFDASLDFSTDPVGVPTSTSGTEVLAYVPSAVYPNLSALTAQTYNKNHQYYVDGSPMVADADLGAPSTPSWKTVLIGAMGAGGKGYYALDISDPTHFTAGSSDAANTLLWEFGPSDDADMGYAYDFPPTSFATGQAKQIVKMANGKWAAILGNGYNSTSGKAVLYVAYINDGTDGWTTGDFVKIVLDAGPNNGLSTPVPFDSDGDGLADTIYAGDLKGHIWKVLVGPNLSDGSVTSAASTWKIAFSTSSWSAGTATLTCSPCAPLFSAVNGSGTVEPIIWPPEVTTHPNGGQLVLFGTGKYLENSDNTNTDVQTFYGIWDRNDGSTTVGTRAADLLQQTVTGVSSGYRTTSANAINWRPAGCSGACTAPTNYMGWYMDLPTSGERTTGIPKLINAVIYFNTFIPSSSPCAAGGTGWLMALDYESGGLVTTPIFDTDSSGTIDSSDPLAGGYEVGAALGGTTLISGASPSTIGVGVSSLTSGVMAINPLDLGAGTRGRVTWREIIQ